MYALRSFLKSTLPAPLWWASKNLYNSCLYHYLWRRRKVMTLVKSGQTISFLIVNPNDVIQGVQATGSFYEEDDLLKIAPHFKHGGVFVDIGANTGQH